MIELITRDDTAAKCATSLKNENSLSILTLDIGTSELKLSVFSALGEVLKTIRTEIQDRSPKIGWIEANPETLWRAVREGIRALGPDLRSTVECAAISGHGESFIALDRDGQPTRNIMLNIDSRSTIEMEEFVSTFGRQQLYESTGLPPHPMYTLPKILWIRHHEPTIFARSAKFLCVEDYLPQACDRRWRSDLRHAPDTANVDAQFESCRANCRRRYVATLQRVLGLLTKIARQATMVCPKLIRNLITLAISSQAIGEILDLRSTIRESGVAA